MASPKQKSKKIWKITDEQKAHITDMLQNAGFTDPVVVNKMLYRICTSKTKTAQSIMRRWFNNRSENGIKKWMNDFLFSFSSSGIKRSELIDILSSNPVLLFSKVETLRKHGKDFQENLKDAGLELSDSVIFNKAMFKAGIFARYPLTLEKNIKGLTKVFEKRGISVKPEILISRGIKSSPTVFMQKPSTLAYNMDETVKRLRRLGYPITKQQYAKACYSQLRLTYRTPETIVANFQRIYALIEGERCRLAVKDKENIKTSENIVQKILSDPSHLGSGADTLNKYWLLACQMREEKGSTPSFTQVVEVRQDDVKKRLTNYRCPLQKAIDNLRQKS